MLFLGGGGHTNKKAHPVGKKANKQTKMSPAVRCRNTKKTTRVLMKPMNNKSFRSLNISWKSALNFFLPMDTICSHNIQSRVEDPSEILHIINKSQKWF